MECLLHRVPGVTVYLDGILFTGSSTEGHSSTLGIQMLQMLRDEGLKEKQNKCVFLAIAVTYVFQQINALKVYTKWKKVKVLWKVPVHRNVTELKGVLSYNSKFFPSLSPPIQVIKVVGSMAI